MIKLKTSFHHHLGGRPIVWRRARRDRSKLVFNRKTNMKGNIKMYNASFKE